VSGEGGMVVVKGGARGGECDGREEDGGLCGDRRNGGRKWTAAVVLRERRERAEKGIEREGS
jgi:hypothetical protein